MLLWDSVHLYWAVSGNAPIAFAQLASYLLISFCSVSSECLSPFLPQLCPLHLCSLFPPCLWFWSDCCLAGSRDVCCEVSSFGGSLVSSSVLSPLLPLSCYDFLYCWELYDNWLSQDVHFLLLFENHCSTREQAAVTVCSSQKPLLLLVKSGSPVLSRHSGEVSVCLKFLCLDPQQTFWACWRSLVLMFHGPLEGLGSIFEILILSFNQSLSEYLVVLSMAKIHIHHYCAEFVVEEG